MSNYEYTGYIFILILLIFVYLILKSRFKRQGVFILLWFIGAILPYLISGTKGYYYSAAGSVSLLILFSFVITKTFHKFLIAGIALYILVISNNYLLIKNQNPKGPNLEIVIQPDMLIPNETSALDYIYQSAESKSFSVNALTVPLNVNTTWSYLFEWYGNKKYGYLPIWATKPAEGFPGNLIYETSRSKLPEVQYVIMEPLNGIPISEINRFKAVEGYFSEIVDEKKFGDIVVQKRLKV